MDHIKTDFVREPKVAIEATKFLDSFLGENLHDPQKLILWATQPSEGAVVAAWDGWDGKKMVGAATCVLLGPDDWDDWEIYDMPHLEEKMRSGTVGLLDSSAVSPQYRGNGIGRKMAQLRIDFLIELGCSTIIASAWDNLTPQQSKHTLESLGFEAISKSQFWLGTTCPVCINNCECDAWLMVKDF